MEEQQTVMKDFACPIIGASPSCILLDNAARNYKLKTVHYNMLPSFHGLPSEDPLIFMRDYYSIIQTFPLEGLTEDQLRMRCFPYTMKDKAKLWLMSLLAGSLTTWEAVYNKFIQKFYSHQKTTELRRKIANFSQSEGESFHEAWERFKMFLIQCPHHRYPLELRNQFFYDGLTQFCQSTVDNAAGGAMGEKSPEETFELYEMLGANSQQKSIRGKSSGVFEVNNANSDIHAQLNKLTTQFEALSSALLNKNSTHETCALCDGVGHEAYVCPINEQVNWVNTNNQREWNDLYSSTYNLGWGNHPNFSWGNNQNQNAQPQVQQFQPKSPSLEETLNNFMQMSQANFQNHDQRLQNQETSMRNQEASMRRLEIQLGQIAETLKNNPSEKLPSQPEQANSLVTLSSSKVIGSENIILEHSDVCFDCVEKEKEAQKQSKGEEKVVDDVSTEEKTTNTSTESEECEKHKKNDTPKSHKAANLYRPPIPSPGHLKKDNKDKSFSDIYDMLSKINVNLPLLDVISNIPVYAKFFKELNIRKRKYEPNAKVMVSETMCAILRKHKIVLEDDAKLIKSLEFHEP